MAYFYKPITLRATVKALISLIGVSGYGTYN